jgi:hypothetical protein
MILIAPSVFRNIYINFEDHIWMTQKIGKNSKEMKMQVPGRAETKPVREMRCCSSPASKKVGWSSSPASKKVGGGCEGKRRWGNRLKKEQKYRRSNLVRSVME